MQTVAPTTANAATPKLKRGAQRDADALANFDKLPNSAGVRLPVVVGVTNTSGPTIYRWVAAGKFPAPRRIGGVSIWNVGELRAALRGPV